MIHPGMNYTCSGRWRDSTLCRSLSPISWLIQTSIVSATLISALTNTKALNQFLMVSSTKNSLMTLLLSFGLLPPNALAVFYMMCVSKFLLPESFKVTFYTFHFYSKTVKKRSIPRDGHKSTSIFSRYFKPSHTSQNKFWSV